MIHRLSLCMMLLAGAVCSSFLGCGKESGPQLGQVTGTVRINGQPVNGLTIYFESTSGATSAGSTNESGKYRLSFPGNRAGAELGNHVVRIIGRDPKVSDKELEGIAGEQGTTADELKKTPVIPAKYNEKSELSAAVNAGKNEIDFNLEF